MVASNKEAEEISKLILSYLPERDAQDLMQEVWEKVGYHTENESLKQTIAILRGLMYVK